MKLAPLLRKLRAVATVATSGGTARAGELLHLSQSAVVRAVQDVEAAIGQPLFERSVRGMRPTPLGQRLAKRAERALDMLAAADPQASRAAVPASWRRSRLAGAVAYRHLEVFLSLVTTASERRTAETLAVSAPAVHQTLVQLEHMAGGPLFDRGRSGLRLTEAGDAVHRTARLALAELAQADEEVAERGGGLTGRVVVGVLPFSTGLFLPRAVEVVLSRRPEISVTVIDGTYDTLLRELRYAGLDLIVGALRESPPGPDVEQETLFLDRLAVIARNGHPLTGRRMAGLRDLTAAEWVLPMPGTPAQVAFEQAFHAERLAPPQGQLRVNSAMVMMALLAESDRLALMSSREVGREVRAGLLSVLPVPVRHGPRRIGITTRSNYLPAAAAQLLLAAIREASAQLDKDPG